jgi:hypothetical protein
VGAGLKAAAALGLMALFWSAGVGVGHAQFHTNTITTPFDVYAYSVDGGPAINPTIQLYAGVTNILNIQTSNDHPVVVTTTISPSDWYLGASPQDVNSQPMALSTPSSGFPTVLYYVCSVHGFYGEIHFSPPAGPAPPPNTILSIRVGTNIVMTSTGTNTTWLLVPEFSSNLMQGAWASVPSWTNRFANGTNTTIFNRLDPICGPNVFLRIRQQQN